MTTPTEPSAEAVMERLAEAFDVAYEDEWERVALSVEKANSSGAADRAATIAGIKAVYAWLLRDREAMQKALEAAADELEADAAKWRALMACARIRTLGLSLPVDSNHGHIGLELWTRYPFPAGTSDAGDRAALAKFMDRAVLAEAALRKGEGT